MTEAIMLSTLSGRARSSYLVNDHVGNCHVDRWLGGQDMSATGAIVVGATFANATGGFPQTTVKRITPGNLAGGLT